MCMLLLVCVSHSQQRTVTVAYLDAANGFVPSQTFQQGLALAGSSSGVITLTAPTNINNYTLVLPSSAGQTGYYICVGSVLGTLMPLAHCPASGSGAPLASITPASMDYGFNTYVGSAKTGGFLITNTGNAQFTFSGTAFTFSGTNSADFTVATTPASTCVNSGSLDGGATCSLWVTFTPGSTGSRSATLSIADNVTGSPQTVSLSGTGI